MKCKLGNPLQALVFIASKGGDERMRSLIQQDGDSFMVPSQAKPNLLYTVTRTNNQQCAKKCSSKYVATSHWP